MILELIDEATEDIISIFIGMNQNALIYSVKNLISP
jgi:hypothetical protein